MKFKYDLLYKSGKEESIVQEGMTEQQVTEITKVIKQSLKNDVQGILTFGNGESGNFIRLSAIDRVKITLLDMEVPDE